MLFNSLAFGCFFVSVTSVYFALPHRFRALFLLLASYFFYMCWSARYITVILAITALDYHAAIAIERAAGTRRRWFLLLSIAGNFGLLFVFKYADFLAESFLGHPWLRLALPLGISFHTFQAVSYTADVYRGRCKAERNLCNYALYVAFFPQMVAGPIERAGYLLPQFLPNRQWCNERVASGLRLALWGLLKKAIVADLAAPVVNAVYGSPRTFSGWMLGTATLLFAVQIYCDFSGYSDMARGTARVLGFDLTANFRRPYLASSPADFWRRWHVSLSTWFRDYLYIPLGGSRVRTLRWCLNILVVFAVSGMWHGANWTFAVWGLLHGVFLLCSSAFDRLPAVARVLLTNVLVAFAWIFFRASSLKDGFYIATHLFGGRLPDAESLDRIGLPRFETAALLCGAVLVFVVESAWGRRMPRAWNNRSVRWAAYAAAGYATVCFGVFEKIEFIYFQF